MSQFGNPQQTGDTYAHQFEKAAATWSARVAARCAATDWSYAELNRQANGLAHHLQKLGVGPEVLVAVSLDRCLDQLRTLLAIWKAGGAYLPVDPSYPTERLAYVLRDSQAQLLLTRRQWAGRFSVPGLKVLCLDASEGEPWEHCAEKPSITQANADTLAYVIYTSGSTGRPKGVEVTHRALLSHNRAIAREYALRPEDRVLQFAPLSFDVSLEEICPSWLSGCTVILRSEAVLASVPRFLDFVDQEAISVLNLPTAYWHELVGHLERRALPACVRLVVIGGERASEAAYQQWKRSAPDSVQLINAYGPTEASITATCYQADPAETTLLIGRAIANTYTLLLDNQLQPVAAGQTGELYLGGPGLARGYRHQPELTAQRFIANPWPALLPVQRLYKTGDLARYRLDGNLEFLGRVDDQVKIRGFRIEPGEVETALLTHPGVRQAVVLAREDTPGMKRLVAYYVTHAGADLKVNDLQRFLRNQLPGYMVPGALIRLETLPLSPAGKVDRQSLPKPDESRPEIEQEFLAAQTSTQEQLAAIWREVLHLKQVGLKDNFFDLGGDSLLGMQILARVRDQWQVELPLSSVFEGQTVEAMAMELEARRSGSIVLPGPKPTAPQGPCAASCVQERLWVLHQLHPESAAYNMPAAFRLRGKFAVTAFTQALNFLVQRHEALRTSFQYSRGALLQVVAPALPLEVPLVSLAQVPANRRERELQRLLESEAHRPFDLEKAPLLRVRLFQLQEADYVLIVVMHHSISDGWSQGIFFKELTSCYAALAAGSPLPALPGLAWRYCDYAGWQRGLLNGHLLDRDLSYWKEHLVGAPAELRWPPTQPLASNPARPAARISLTFPAKVTRAALQFAQRERATAFMVLLTSLALTFHHWTGQKDLVLGTVVAGRSRREVEHLLGCFMNFLPLRIRLRGDEQASDVLRQVRQVVLEAQAHQECPFEQIVQTLNPQRHGERNPLYNVALLWHNYPAGHSWASAGLQASPIALDPQQPLLDLRFEAEPRGEEWCLVCEYDTSRFSEPTITRLLATFAHCLKRLIQAPHTGLADLVQGRGVPGSWLRRWWPFWPKLNWTQTSET